MPLHDHFHSPWSDENLWEGFHSAWANTIVRHLNESLLPAQFRAIPQILDHHVCGVRVYDAERGMRLFGAIEQVGLIIVDIVTERRANLHEELLRLVAPGQSPVSVSHLYAVAYRAGPNGRLGRLDTWPASLAVGQPLPTLPLWLLGELPIPIDLERTYEETCRVLRIR